MTNTETLLQGFNKKKLIERALSEKLRKGVANIVNLAFKIASNENPH